LVIPSIKPYTYSHSIQGVQVKPLTENGREISILYNGRLARAGANAVYIHYGFGDHGDWQDVDNQPMSRRDEGWEKSLTLTKGNQLNFCFKDGAGNWDNNNGSNWAYRITG